MATMQHLLHEHPLHETDPRTIYPGGQWRCDNCDTLQEPVNFPYNCISCSFDLCQKCVNGYHHPRHNHVLFLIPMIKVYPEYLGEWKCDACGLIKRDMPGRIQSHAYHCPRCKVDICQQCFIGKLYAIHIHPLKPADAINVYGSSSSLWVCDSCHRNGEQLGSRYAWHCSACEFDACKDCLKNHIFPWHPHPLKITDCRVAYPEFGGGWKCDLCGAVGGLGVQNMDKSYHCDICEFDACMACVSRREVIASDVAGAPRSMYLRGRSTVQLAALHRPPVEDMMLNDLPVENEEDLDEIPPNLDDSQKCSICMERPKNATIVHGNTGHVCCCIGCARTLMQRHDRCPICRALIDRVIRHYES